MINLHNVNYFLLFLTTINCEYASNVIDMDDILSENFMPGTLLVLENPTSGIKVFNESIKSVQVIEEVADGSFGNAMETMNFHRSMMNEYLCRNFVAEQIINDMTTSRIKRRMGHITPGSDGASTKPSTFKPAMQNNLLNDEGFSSYKNWLSKSTTLEDIYRHYDNAQNRIDGDIIEEEDKGEDFDEEYAGYVYPHPHEQQTPVKHRGHTGLGIYYGGGGKYQGGGYPYPNAVYHNNGGGDYHHGGGSEYQHGGGSSGYHYSGGSDGHHSGGGGGGGGGGGYHHGGDSGYHYSGGGGGDYSDHDNSGGGHYGGGHHAIVETVYTSPPKYHGEPSYGGKDHDLSDLFDIALTALAFLSFGLFIVHVIMCISAASYNTTTTAASMMMPMSMSPTATATGGTGTGNGGGGGSMTSTGGGGGNTAAGGGTSPGATGAGTGDGMTATGTGGGADGGMTATGGDSPGMGDGDAGTGGGGGDTESTGGGDTDTGGGDIDQGGGGTGTGMGGGDTGAGGGENGGGGTTGSTSPGTGTGGGTTGDGTGTGGGATGTGTGADGGTGTGSGKDTFKFRLRRDIPTITNPNNEALNELARRVLTSIEAALVANIDDGVCLRKSLCENNKYSRTLDGKDKLVIPMWSLGMSWLAGRLVKNAAPATSMLDTLKASILGLGKANCEIIYQDCDLRRQRKERRRRRRKRSAI